MYQYCTYVESSGGFGKQLPDPDPSITSSNSVCVSSIACASPRKNDLRCFVKRSMALVFVFMEQPKKNTLTYIRVMCSERFTLAY